jgi:hypothetical protein
VLPIFITTSSEEEAQGGFAIVHRNVTLLPETKPVTPDVGLEGVMMEAVPLMTVQVPAPVAGVLPAKLAEVTAHRF